MTIPQVPIVHAIPLTITQPLISEEQILNAATRVMEGYSYKCVCLEMGINLKNGVYLGSSTSDYKRLQRAVRTLRRRECNRNLQSTTTQDRGPERKTKTQQIVGITQEVTQLRVRAETAEQQSREVLKQLSSIKRERDTALSKVTILTERLTTVKQQTDDRVMKAERQAQDAKKRERRAVKKCDAMIKTLESTKKLLQELRVFRKQYSQHPNLLKERDEALKRITLLTESVMAAEKKVEEASVLSPPQKKTRRQQHT